MAAPGPDPTETKHRHDYNKKNPHQGSDEKNRRSNSEALPVQHGAPRRPRPIFADFLCACLARDRLRRSTCLRARDGLNVPLIFGERTLEENSPDRPLLRVALTPGFAVTDHRAAYDVAVLADPGGVGPAMLPPPPCRLATPK